MPLVTDAQKDLDVHRAMEVAWAFKSAGISMDNLASLSFHFLIEKGGTVMPISQDYGEE